MPVLDTCFLIDLDHGNSEALAILDRLVEGEATLRIPAVVALEFAGGSRNPAQAWRRMREGYAVIDFSAALAERASHLAHDSLRRGHFPGWSDVQVAATALELGEPVVTANGASFRKFRGLKLITYRGPA